VVILCSWLPGYIPGFCFGKGVRLGKERNQAMETIFQSVTQYPDRHDANGVLMRLVDGLGYRFYWATEGLSETDYSFSPGPDSPSIGRVVAHIWGLTNWIRLNFLGPAGVNHRPPEGAAQREQALTMLADIRAHVAALDGGALFALTIDGHPFWHVINGPLSDALTHVGQIASFRRLNRNPVPKHNVFLCHE
ncbi:MAG: hypothetical protein NTZ09_00490, partial [Candidatus Hydrogenedentes bacterium]|jgi:hypothetical protein|nr:hypothetical protein [Candidatus Hydrogenedentota bacterium]